MRKRFLPIATMALAALFAGCSSGPIKRVSPPAASVQQLTVNMDGSWTVQLRLQNYSSVPMRFQSAALDMGVAGLPAGRLDATPGISIGPESADVASVSLRPTSEARIAVADALARRGPLAYTLKGKVEATPEDASSRSFDIDAKSSLNPVPGLDGVLR